MSTSRTFLPFAWCMISLVLRTQLALDISATSSTLFSQTFTTSEDNEFEGGTITCTKHDCIVICNTKKGCSRTQIHASSSTNLTLTCIGDYACNLMFVFCPSNPSGSCNIDCGAKFNLATCGLMQVFTPTEESIHLDCGTAYAVTSCENSNVFCSSSSSSALTTRSSLQYMFDEYGLYGSWVCSTGGCCPFALGTLDCAQQTDECVIDCTTTDCSDYIIDGSTASHLTVNCNSASGGCIASTIKCPTNGSGCAVNCDNTESCYGISVEGTGVDSLQLTCAGNASCHKAAVYCPSNADNVCSIDCNSDSHYSCYDMNIRANSYYEDKFVMEIDCGSDDTYAACEDTTFGCAIEGRETVSFLWDDTESEWKCESVSSSYCCPWGQSVDDDEDVIDTVLSHTNTQMILFIVIGIIVFCAIFCIVCFLLCIKKKKEMQPYAMNTAPAPVNRRHPAQPATVAMVQGVGGQQVVQPIIQKNIPIMMVNQPLYAPAPVAVPNASAPPQYQAIHPQVPVEEEEGQGPEPITQEGPEPVTHF